MSEQNLSETEKKTREIMLTLPLFDAFRSDELDILARHMRFAEIMRGEHLFVEGDRGYFMCFVVRGLLDVLKQSVNGGDHRVIARLGKGNTIGEMSLIDQSPRSATVVARQPSIVIILTNKEFKMLTEAYPTLGVALLKIIMRLLSFNMRMTTAQLANQLPDERHGL